MNDELDHLPASKQNHLAHIVNVLRDEVPSGDALSRTCVRNRCLPVMNEALEGTHRGELQYALANTAPASASRCMFGVLTNGCSYGAETMGLRPWSQPHTT